jgi:hypothetical protein
MARPCAAVPTEHLHVKLDAPLRAQLDLFLYSELEGRVPKGAYKGLIEGLLREFFGRHDAPTPTQLPLDLPPLDLPPKGTPK